MSQVTVKWVNPKDLHDEKPVWDKAELFVVPVVPLSALREVVEGLRMIRDDTFSEKVRSEWLADKDAVMSMSQWLAQRLLASLGEVKDVPEIGFGNRKEMGHE